MKSASYSPVCSFLNFLFTATVGGKNENGGGGQTYQQPKQQTVPQQPAPENTEMSYGDLGEYEELLSEDDMPF